MKHLGFPLYFNHVPKCAGTSLNEILSRNIRRDRLGVEPFVTAAELYTLPAARFDRLALVASHVPHWVAARRLQGWTWLTILREPWSRFQALCRHLVRVQDSEPQALLPPQVKFLSLLRHGRHDAAMLQTRAWYAIQASMTSYLLPDPIDGSDWPSDAHEQAIGVLSSYDLVLVTAHLEEEALWIDRVFNGQEFGAPARLNTSARYNDATQGPFPARFSKVFADLHPYELQTYAAACERYPATHAWLRGELEQGRGGPRFPATVATRLYTLDWELPTRCGGFSDRLLAQSLGYVNTVARRVEAEVAVLDFDIPWRGAARIEAVVWVAPVGIEAEVKLKFNGRPLALFGNSHQIADPNQIWSYIDVDAATIGDGRCRLEIDRRDARGLMEFWLLDLVVRSR